MLSLTKWLPRTDTFVPSVNKRKMGKRLFVLTWVIMLVSCVYLIKATFNLEYQNGIYGLIRESRWHEIANAQAALDQIDLCVTISENADMFDETDTLDCLNKLR